MQMVKTICDREGCKGEVKDSRKVAVMRFNPYNKYASFHLCSYCEKMVFTFLRGFMEDKIIPGPSGNYELHPERDYDKEYWEILGTVVERLKKCLPIWGEV